MKPERVSKDESPGVEANETPGQDSEGSGEKAILQFITRIGTPVNQSILEGEMSTNFSESTKIGLNFQFQRQLYQRGYESTYNY